MVQVELMRECWGGGNGETEQHFIVVGPEWAEPMILWRFYSRQGHWEEQWPLSAAADHVPAEVMRRAREYLADPEGWAAPEG